MPAGRPTTYTPELAKASKPWNALGIKDSTKKSFWSRVRKGDASDCWEWGSYRDRDGYGKFKTDGAPRAAHRIAYELANGVALADLHACHSCDNPPCCNPAHLWAGTCLENRRDSVAKNRVNRNVKNAGWQGKSKCCLRGHEFTPENTHIRPTGKRLCRTCDRMRKRAYSKGETVPRPDKYAFIPIDSNQETGS